MRKIPVFVSCPTDLNPEQEQKRKTIDAILSDLQLEPRALGKSDYPVDYPLKEVYSVAKHCSGGIILGFEQMYLKSGIIKRGIGTKEKAVNDICLPTEWNNLEAGILFGMNLPLLIFKEDTIRGGVFDLGNTEIYVHSMPCEKPDNKTLDALKQVFLRWHARVSEKYYEFP